MASYQVAQGDSLLTISNKTGVPYLELLAGNPGVQTVKPGQVINVNSKFSGAGIGTGGTNTTGNSFGNTPARPSGNTFSYAPAGNNSYGSLNTPPPPSQANFQTPPTNGFNAPAGYTNLTPSQSQNIPPSAGNVNLTPSQSQNIPTATTTQSQPTKPAGTYTGDPNDPNTAAWKAYWNYSAQNPSQAQSQGQGNAPRVMSRSEIWNMKADSRRKKMAMSAGDNQTSGGGGDSPATPVAQPDLIRNIVWGING